MFSLSTAFLRILEMSLQNFCCILQTSQTLTFHTGCICSPFSPKNIHTLLGDFYFILIILVGDSHYNILIKQMKEFEILKESMTKFIDWILRHGPLVSTGVRDWTPFLSDCLLDSNGMAGLHSFPCLGGPGWLHKADLTGQLVLHSSPAHKSGS